MPFIDDTFPLLVHVAPPVFTPELITQMHAEYETYFRRGERYALFTFRHEGMGQMGAKERKSVGEWANSPRVRAMSEKLCVGSATLAVNALERGAMTALMWFWKPACPHRVVGTTEEGLDWCLRQLADAGIPLGRDPGDVRRSLMRRLRAPEATTARAG